MISTEATGVEEIWSELNSGAVGSARSDRVAQTKNIPEIPRTSYAYKLGLLAIAMAISMPLVYGPPWSESSLPPCIGAVGGVARQPLQPIFDTQLERRDDSPTDVCTRWAHQSTIVNGTLYIYGGEATTSPSQTSNTWNNDFLTLDLTSTWEIAAPSLTGLPQPSGPPNVSLGTLWNSHSSLYLYGGEFSDAPVESPTAFSLWEYDILSAEWVEHDDPTTSAGTNSEAAGEAVQRAAEGAGISVPSLGRGWYFGGHQDGYTTEGWSQSIYRIYLKSLLEFTFPGAQNTQVTTLSDGQTAGSDGVWRNVTEGGSQNSSGFPERADGLLLYVPGFGAEGLLVGLGGGTNETLTQMNVIDVYDIATSTWYKQATSGSTPQTRVNPCAVVAAAPDGSSYNVYMFGGQNLLPADNQTQLNDMWILTTPSFTWIEVNQSSQSVPYARAGHTCNIWQGQMVVVGGYIGDEISCDSPGIYVYDMSSLTWVEQFTIPTTSNSSTSTASKTTTTTASVSSAKTADADTLASNPDTNPYNQQPAQLANSTDGGGLEGSYGYEVPAAIISVIGGNSAGGATITAPQVTAADGPLATGKALTYTVTEPGGATATETSYPGSNGNGTSSENSSSSGGGPNVAAIVAGTIAGLLFLLVCYLAFCAWLYRKQLVLYKRHVDMAQRRAQGEKRGGTAGTTQLSMAQGYASDTARQEGVKASMSRAINGAITKTGGFLAADSRSYSEGENPAQRSSDDDGELEDLLDGHEPTFLGVMLAPRRSLRVINRD